MREKDKERSERLGYTTCTTQITRSKETKSVLIQYTHPVYKESIYHTILMARYTSVCIQVCACMFAYSACTCVQGMC